MKGDTRDDLVSITAIVAGAVVSVVVTIASLIMTDEDSLSPTPASSDGPRSEAFTDPRGPERGRTALEWEVMWTYEALESMRLRVRRLEQSCDGGSVTLRSPDGNE